MKCLLKTCLSLVLGLALMAVGAAANADEAPDQMIQSVFNDVLATVKADREMQAGNVQKIAQMVDQKIMPHANFQRTTQMAMGRNWARATVEQQQQITREFKLLLIRTYAGALAQVKDTTIQFKPLRMAPTDTEVVVRSIVQNNGSPAQLDYRLEKTASGWKVYDINVLGVWLVEAYRNQFAEQISQNGIDGLIAFLQQRNRQLAGKR